jgi:hypothetical protein
MLQNSDIFSIIYAIAASVGFVGGIAGVFLSLSARKHLIQNRYFMEYLNRRVGGKNAE